MRTKGSRNIKPSKEELYKALDTKNIEQKAVAPAFGRLDSLVVAPKVISNNPYELIKLSKGFVGICNSKNATSIASTPLRLFAIKNSKSQKFLYRTKSLSKSEIDRIKTSSHSIVVKNAEDIVEIMEHPVFNVLNSVNQDLNYYDLMELTASYLGLIGNAFWAIKSKNGVPVSIKVLPSEYTTIKMANDLSIIGYRVFNGVYEENYRKDEVIHFKNCHPGLFWRVFNNALTTGLYGIGDLEYVLDEVYLYNSINDYLRALTENNAIPSGIVKYTGGRLDKNTLEDVQKQWDRVTRSWRRAGKTKVMDQDFDWIPISMAPRELDFAEGRRWLMTVIAGAFGVPTDLISTENSNRATSNVAIQNYFRFSIKPRLKRIEERLNSHFINLFDDNLFFEFDECVPTEATLAVKQEDQDLNNGTRTINEVRAERGLGGPVEWGDEPYAPKKETIRENTDESDANKKEDRESMNEEERNERGNENAEKETNQ